MFLGFRSAVRHPSYFARYHSILVLVYCQELSLGWNLNKVYTDGLLSYMDSLPLWYFRQECGYRDTTVYECKCVSYSCVTL